MPTGYEQINPEPEKRNPVTQWVKDNHAKQPSLMAQIGAMIREAVKDIRQTMNESFFGQGEHMPEAGTPMNLTQQQITQEQGNVASYQAAIERATHGLPDHTNDRNQGREH